MPQPVKCYRADIGPLDDLIERMREVARVDGRAIEPGEHKATVIAPKAQGQPFF